jgi:uncharacterized membrane protein
MKNNKDKIFKSNVGGSAFEKELRSDLEENMQKFKDPIILGELVYKLLEERENTNRILKNVLARLEELERKSGKIAEEETLLPEVDEQILDFVRNQGKVTAEDVREKFKYKGKNAASARLNRLCNIGLLKKKQAGKKVFFFP